MFKRTGLEVVCCRECGEFIFGDSSAEFCDGCCASRHYERLSVVELVCDVCGRELFGLVSAIVVEGGNFCDKGCHDHIFGDDLYDDDYWQDDSDDYEAPQDYCQCCSVPLYSDSEYTHNEDGPICPYCKMDQEDRKK